MTAQLDRWGGFAAVAFLLIAPIYWLPLLPDPLVTAAKMALFGAALLLAALVLWRQKEIGDAAKLIGVFIVFLLVASVVGLAQTGTSGAIRHLQTIALPACGLLIGFASWRFLAAHGLRIYVVCMTVIAVFAWFCSVAFYGNDGGFAYLRTGWSGSLAYAAVIALVFMGLSTPKRSIVLWGLCYGLITASMLYYGGRAAALFPILAYAIVLMIGGIGPRVRNAGLAVGVFVVVMLAPFTMKEVVFFYQHQIATQTTAASSVPATDPPTNTPAVPAQSPPPAKPTPKAMPPATPSLTGAIERQLRIVHDNRPDYINIFDRVTSGRIGLVVEAWGLIKEKPITGYGFTAPEETGLWKGALVHNEWLKAWYQGGPLYLAGVLVMFAAFGACAWRADRLSDVTGFPPIFRAIVLFQLFTSMVEPNSIIGVFYKSSPLWVLLGAATWIALVKYRRSRLPTAGSRLLDPLSTREGA